MVLRDAAQEPSVQRIFVNAADQEGAVPRGQGRPSWLSKIGRCGVTIIISTSVSPAARQPRLQAPTAADGR